MKAGEVQLAQSIITKELSAWAHEVRLLGGDAAHPPKNISDDAPVTPDDAEDILLLLDKFIEVLYIAPKVAEELRKKRTII